MERKTERTRGRLLQKSFYTRSPERVAMDLLGKLLVRHYGHERMTCMITETEAYYGEEDPASRARRGGDLRERMYGEPGRALVYGIHRQWLLNIVAHPLGEGGAVLIRSCMPVEGIEKMAVNRGVNSRYNLTTGPGKLTKALKIDKSLHGAPLYEKSSGLWVEEYRSYGDRDIVRTWRIGVSEDLPYPCRFYLKNSYYVSKKL